MPTTITVMSSGSAEPGLDFVAAAFKKETGHDVRIEYNVGADGSKRLAKGEPCDVTVATSNSLNRSYLPQGLVKDDAVSIGRVGLGAMVRPGIPVPDISSIESLKRAVLDAERVLITTETSGQCIISMLQKLGIYDQVQAKMTEKFSNAPSIMTRVLQGSGNEFGFLSTNAIRTFKDKGLVFAGPLPDEVQFLRDFMAVTTASSRNPDVAKAFVRFCGGPGKAIMLENGFV